MNTKCLFLLLCLIICCIRYCDSYYINNTAWRIVGKCAHMKRELVMDAQMKIKGIGFIQRTYYKNFMYSLGEQFFEMKFRYQRMMALYSEMEELYGLEYQLFRTNLLVQIQRLAIESNKIADVAEAGEKRELRRKEIHINFMKSLRKGKERPEDDNKKNSLRSKMANFTRRSGASSRRSEIRGASRPASRPGAGKRPVNNKIPFERPKSLHTSI